MIRSLRSLGKTVLLTTHYLDEAEQLADRVAVLRDGVIVRLGTPRELTTADLEVEIRYRSGGEDVVVRTTEPTRVLNELTGDALARGEELDSLEVRRPTLEQVYLDLIDEENTAVKLLPAISCARSSSSSGAAARRRSSSSSSRCCSSSCSARSTTGTTRACRSRGPCSPGSSRTAARTRRSPASRSSS